MKRIRFRLLCAMMAACLLGPCPAARAEGETRTYTDGTYFFSAAADGTAELLTYTGSESDVAVPAVLGGMPVTVIGYNAFPSSPTPVTITLPDSVVRIRYAAFVYCTALTTVVLPDSVAVVEGNPFINCPRLTRIVLSPDHPALEMVNGVLFSKGDRRLICCPMNWQSRMYAIPEGTLGIAECAFYKCANLTRVTIPDSVMHLGDRAFFLCSGLTAVTIPAGVTEVGLNPFAACKALTAVAVAPENPVLTTVDGVLFGKADRRLICYPIGRTDTAYTVPQGIRDIGGYAFSNSPNLTRVTLPDGVTSIGRYAFLTCEKLTEVNIPDGVTTIDYGAFYSCTALTSLRIPASVTSIGDRAFDQCPNLTLIVPRDSYAAARCREMGLPFTYD